MKNIYDGGVTTDTNGEALVTLPDWLQALNGDFRYQLTCLGRFAPVYVSQEVQNHQFRVAGGKPGMRISWQVTWVRHDAFALAHPLQVEQDKPDKEQGLYQNPDAFGLPVSRGLGHKAGAVAERFTPMIQGVCAVSHDKEAVCHIDDRA